MSSYIVLTAVGTDRPGLVDEISSFLATRKINIEDSRMAVREARRAGHAVFGITVDRDGKSWFPRMFGQGGFALIPHPDKLTQALPEIYRQLVGA